MANPPAPQAPTSPSAGSAWSRSGSSHTPRLSRSPEPSHSRSIPHRARHARHTAPSPAPAPACTRSPHRRWRGSSFAHSQRSASQHAQTAQSSHPAGCPSEFPASTYSSRSLRLLLRSHINILREAAHSAFVAHQPIALNLDLEEERIVVTIGRSLDHPQPIAARLPLHPKLLPRPAPERDKARLKRLRVTHFVQEAEHHHLASLRVLDDARNQAIHLCKVNLHRIKHSHLSWSAFHARK